MGAPEYWGQSGGPGPTWAVEVGGVVVLRTVIWTAVGLALAALGQWAASGAHGLPAAVPAWAPAILPWGLPLCFGLFLAGVYGGAPGTGTGLAGAAAGLLLAGLPLAYAHGLAQRYGLPLQVGLPGRLLAGSTARLEGAVWAGICLIQAWRTKTRTFRLAEAPPLWTDGPVDEDARAAAYIPVDSSDS